MRFFTCLFCIDLICYEILTDVKQCFLLENEELLDAEEPVGRRINLSTGRRLHSPEQMEFVYLHKRRKLAPSLVGVNAFSIIIVLHFKYSLLGMCTLILSMRMRNPTVGYSHIFYFKADKQIVKASSDMEVNEATSVCR